MCCRDHHRDHRAPGDHIAAESRSGARGHTATTDPSSFVTLLCDETRMSADLDVTEDATSSRSSVYALGVAFAGDGRGNFFR